MPHSMNPPFDSLKASQDELNKVDEFPQELVRLKLNPFCGGLDFSGKAGAVKRLPLFFRSHRLPVGKRGVRVGLSIAVPRWHPCLDIVHLVLRLPTFP